MPKAIVSSPPKRRSTDDISSCVCLLLASQLSVFALTACGEPLIATIAVIETDDTEGDADDATFGGRSNEAGINKGQRDPHDGGARDATSPVSAAVPDDPDCVGLPDVSVVWAGMPADSEVIANKGAELGCPSADAGVQVRNDIVYRLRNGERIVERGEVYSLQWPAFLPITRVRIHGGDQHCPLEPLVDVPVNLLAKGSIGVVTCQQFTAPLSSRQVHLYGNEDFTALQQWSPGPPMILQLCRKPCPPNSQYDPDAGVATDASTQP